MNLDFEGITDLVDCKKRKRLLISGQADPVAITVVLEARDRGWVEPIYCGNSFTGAIGEMGHLFPSSGVEGARLKALGMMENRKAEFLLDTGPINKEFFSLLTEGDICVTGSNILSYVSIMRVPKDSRLTLLTDTLINDVPGIKEKIGIAQNAIQVANALGINQPKIAAITPLELVNPVLQSTLDAAILSKMSDRGQFGNAVIEGPLGMDNAESASAARHKGINSPVPGDVDIYLFPDLESANIIAQFLAWLGRSQFGGVLIGTSFPVIVRSPLESPESLLINLALALLLGRNDA